MIRDFSITGIKDLDRNWGSGYPADPVTKKWLQNNFDPVFGFPNIVRFSWATITNYFEEKKF